MPAAGVLLTGGSSRRMGWDKATLRVGGETLAERTGRLLGAATEAAVEVGPGHSRLPSVSDETPGAGPLAAMATGVARLAADGWNGPILVVATDLPRLDGRLLVWLAGHPAACSVLPLAGGRPQPLCARYSERDWRLAVELAERGARSMQRLLESIDPLAVGPALWLDAAGDEGVLGDADTPEELARLVVDIATPGELEGTGR